MDEHELREAFRDTMTKSRPPTAMRTQDAVRAGRRALRRQRLSWAGAATAAAAVIAVVTVAASARYTSMDQPAHPRIVPSVAAVPSPSLRAWPTGPDSSPQEGSTARAGKQYETGVVLLDRLVGVVPAGYTVIEGPGQAHQATYSDWTGARVWTYEASVQVFHGGATGLLLVEVREPRHETAAPAGCALAADFWSKPGDCREITVGPARVGVALRPAADDERLDQWAAYRHPDGTVVIVAQAKADWTGESAKPLPALPFTVQQLAALAVDDRFHVD